MGRVATEIGMVDGRRIEFRRVGPTDAGARTVVVLHGGHMSASCRFGEEALVAAGWSVLVVSRPGYGLTEVAAGPSVPEFAVRLAALCAQLGIGRVTALGISLGARSALTLAAFSPNLVSRVILMCPVSFSSWPPPRSRRIGRVVFASGPQAVTWGITHALLRRDPARHLPTVVANLTTLPGAEAVARLGADRQAMIDFLLSCRSGSGFSLDLRPPTDVTAQVRQPTLILATRTDGSVSWDHPARLAAALSDAELAEVAAPTHILWLGDGAAQLNRKVTDFLDRD